MLNVFVFVLVDDQDIINVSEESDNVFYQDVIDYGMFQELQIYRIYMNLVRHRI